MLGYQFGITGLYSKVSLRKCYLFLLWISILSNQIASVSGKHKILYFTLTSFAECDHFRDLTKMIIHIDPLRFTRIDSAPDCDSKILPSGIAQQLLKFSGKPYLDLLISIITIDVLLYAIE